MSQAANTRASTAAGLRPVVEPSWMTTARHLIGQREVPGPATNGVIAAMLRRLGAWWNDDETPWCGAIVATCLDDHGFPIPKAWYRAKAWITWGRTWAPGPNWPAYGAIAVMDRKGGGHVGFYVGPAPAGDGQLLAHGRPPAAMVYILGGNQDNQVCVRAYPLSRVVAWRWPEGYPVTGYKPDATRWPELLPGAHVAQGRSEA
jgi:uncharacterized protein (TIGR02594 family)